MKDSHLSKMKLLLSFLLLTSLTWEALAQSCPSNAAPNDQVARCVTDDPQYRHTYPNDWRVLMDSNNYLELIDDRDGVWQRQDVDGTGTTWRQYGGICGHEVSVCEYYSPSSPVKNNWFFTQYICYRDAREVIVSVNPVYTGCIYGCQTQVTFHRYERNDTNAAAARDPNNYDHLQVVTGTCPICTHYWNTDFHFRPLGNYRGFYIGVQDTGSCVSIRRLILYYRISPGRTEGVTVIPEIALPPLGSTEPSTGVATCLPNAVPAPGTSMRLECDANGVCTDDPECVCSHGYEFVAATANSTADCRVCPPGTYQARDSNDFSCQPCPANSEARDPATAVCECEFDFNRPPGQPDEPCTKPPSSPRVAINNPPIVSCTSITVCWLPSLETGGGSDLHYNIYLLEFGGGSNTYQRVMTVNSNTNANPNTPISHIIQNLTPGANYSVVISAANGVTDDPDSFTDVFVVQDRFILFYFATGGVPSPDPGPPSSPRVAINNPPIVSGTSITVCWLPSLDTGEGNDLHYNIYLLEFGGGSNAYQCILTVKSSIDANPNTPLCHTIRDLTPETSYSVVIAAANSATDDPDSFADVSVVQDRFIVFYFVTLSSPSPSPSLLPPTASTERSEDDKVLSLKVGIGITLIITLLITAIVTAIIVLLIAWCLHKGSMSKHDISSSTKNPQSVWTDGTTNGSSLEKPVEMQNPAYRY